MRGFVAIDASSLRGDAFTYIAGRIENRVVTVEHVSGWEGDQLRTVSLHTMVAEISKCARQFSTRTVFGDQREEAALGALFREQNITLKSYAWSEPSKDAAVMWLRRLMRERKLLLPDHARLRREMLNLKARLMPSGRTRYESNGLDYVSALITLAHAALDTNLMTPVSTFQPPVSFVSTFSEGGGTIDGAGECYGLPGEAADLAAWLGRSGQA